MKNRKSLAIKIGMFLAVWLLFRVLYIYTNFSPNEDFNISFEGIVTEKKMKQCPRPYPQVLIYGYNEPFAMENKEYFNKITLGDYLIKKKGTLDYLLIHRGDTFKFKRY